MYQIKVRNFKNNSVVGSYSFKTRSEARKTVDAICKHHELKKCGYDYMNYALSLELEFLF